MLGHHHVADHHKAVGNASFFEDLKKEIATGDGTEPRVTLVATDGDEVKILGTIITMQASGHEASLRPASNSEFSGRKFFLLVVSFPKSIAHPFAKSAKGWGTPAYTPCRRWATRQKVGHPPAKVPICAEFYDNSGLVAAAQYQGSDVYYNPYYRKSKYFTQGLILHEAIHNLNKTDDDLKKLLGLPLGRAITYDISDKLQEVGCAGTN